MNAEVSDRRRDRVRARQTDALAVADTLNALKGKHRARAGTLARRLPSAIQFNGLAQHVAFLLAKSAGKDGNRELAEGALLDALADWLGSKGGLSVGPGGDKGRALMKATLDADRHAYLWAQAEAIAWAGCLKRFAEALLPDEEAVVVVAAEGESGA